MTIPKPLVGLVALALGSAAPPRRSPPGRVVRLLTELPTTHTKLILAMLAASGRLTAEGIIQQLAYPTSLGELRRILTILQRDGLIRRVRDSHDGRWYWRIRDGDK